MAASAFLPAPPPELRSKLGFLVTHLPAISLDAQSCVDLGRILYSLSTEHILYSLSTADVGEAGAGGSRDGGGGGGGEGAGGGLKKKYAKDDGRNPYVSGSEGGKREEGNTVEEGGKGEKAGEEEELRWVRVLMQRVLTRRDAPEVQHMPQTLALNPNPKPYPLNPNPKPCAD